MKNGGTDILIVGAGVYGLACAWSMASRRTGARITVLDAGEFAGGASGRNGAGFRAQWGLELNIRLCLESIAFFENAAERLGYPDGIDLKQGGYLALSHSERTRGILESCLPLQHQFGVKSEMLGPDDCVRMVPALRRDRLTGGSFCATDGTISPFRWLDALLTAARREGAEVRYGVRVDRISRVAGRFEVQAGAERFEADKVLLCTDWEVPTLLKPLGVDLPVGALAKEVVVTAPCAPMIGPIVLSLVHTMAVNQVERGNIVFTVARAREDPVTRSSPDFLNFAAARIVDLVPGAAEIPVVRTWGGVSSLTPDMQPLLGETEVEGLYVAVSSYRGLMTSPAVGRMMASLILDGDTNDPLLNQLSPYRFRAGRAIVEPLVIQE
jgi:sarcosine oxidase subunit beta